MSAPLTGANGKVYINSVEITDVQNWAYSRTADNKAYNSSETGGQTYRLKGNRDSTLTFDALIDAGELDPGFNEGDEVRFTGYSDSGKYVDGMVLIDSISQPIAVESKDVEKVSVSASQSQGCLTII